MLVAIETRDVKPNAEGKFQCPDCAHPPYPSKAGLASHRWGVHKFRSLPKKLASRALRGVVIKTDAIPVSAIKRRGGKLQCPECPRSFRYPSALGRHRRTAHGILGNSPSSIANRANGGSGNRKLKCTELGCKAKPFDSPRDLGRHRLQMHGIPGQSLSSIRRKQLEEEANSTGGRKTHNGSKSRSNQHQNSYENDSEALAQLEFQNHVIWLTGGAQKEIQIYAESHGIPWTLLAQGVADLLRLSSGRKVVGSHRSLPTLHGQT